MQGLGDFEGFWVRVLDFWVFLGLRDLAEGSGFI